jgi:hypothetical protein
MREAVIIWIGSRFIGIFGSMGIQSDLRLNLCQEIVKSKKLSVKCNRTHRVCVRTRADSQFVNDLKKNNGAQI